MERPLRAEEAALLNFCSQPGMPWAMPLHLVGRLWEFETLRRRATIAASSTRRSYYTGMGCWARAVPDLQCKGDVSCETLWSMMLPCNTR